MVEILDDTQYEPDEQFYLKLSLTAGTKSSRTPGVSLGRISIMEVTVLNDDGQYTNFQPFLISYVLNQCPSCFSFQLSDPGTITFEERGILVKESVGVAQIPVLRKNGADGEVSVRWRTIGKLYRNQKSNISNPFRHTQGLYFYAHR